MNVETELRLQIRDRTALYPLPWPTVAHALGQIIEATVAADHEDVVVRSEGLVPLGLSAAHPITAEMIGPQMNFVRPAM